MVLSSLTPHFNYSNIITVITVNLYSAFLKKKNPKRAACASLVEREEKGFDMALKR